MACPSPMALSAERAFQSERMIAEVRPSGANWRGRRVGRSWNGWTRPWGGTSTQRKRRRDAGSAGAPAGLPHALGEDPPTPERLSLCQRLDQVTHASELMGQLLEAAMLAGAAGANAAQPMERQVPPEVLRRMLQQQFGAQLGQVQQLVVLTQLFTYDALSDAELRLYLDCPADARRTAIWRIRVAALTAVHHRALGRFMHPAPGAIGACEGVIALAPVAPAQVPPDQVALPYIKESDCTRLPWNQGGVTGAHDAAVGTSTASRMPRRRDRQKSTRRRTVPTTASPPGTHGPAGRGPRRRSGRGQLVPVPSSQSP